VSLALAVSSVRSFLVSFAVEDAPQAERRLAKIDATNNNPNNFFNICSPDAPWFGIDDSHFERHGFHWSSGNRQSNFPGLPGIIFGYYLRSPWLIFTQR
jgi:hypothetical protein